MKRVIVLSVAGLLGMSAPIWAGGLCCLDHGVHCIQPPPPTCPDCGDPCSHRLRLTLFGTEHAQQLIDELQSERSCDRIKAARKLGSRLHADFCRDPEVVLALVRALQCDTCWQVRKTAAWSIAYQGARTPLGVLSLYLAALLDPHYLVRDAAADALDVLTVGRRECYRDLFAAGNNLAKSLQGRYQPTKGQCFDLFEQSCVLCGVAPEAAGAEPLDHSSGLRMGLSAAQGRNLK